MVEHLPFNKNRDFQSPRPQDTSRQCNTHRPMGLVLVGRCVFRGSSRTFVAGLGRLNRITGSPLEIARLDASPSFGKTQPSMKAHSRPLTLRLAALLQMIVLLPPMLAGSICLRDEKVATLEFWCACTNLPEPGTMTAISTPTSPECGPCRDLIIAALAGSRVIAPGMQPGGDIQAPSNHPEMDQVALCPSGPRHSGDPPRRPPSVLRC